MGGFPYGNGYSSELVQAVDRFVTHTPLRNTNHTGSTGFGAARDILVVALAVHNTAPQYVGYRH